MPNSSDSKKGKISNGVSEFLCLRCGDCCKWSGYIYITEDDVKRISEFLSLSEFEFVNRYAEIAQRPRLNLKTKENGECIFLKEKDCSIQSIKPKQCADFPSVWRIKEIESFCRGQRKMREDTRRP